MLRKIIWALLVFSVIDVCYLFTPLSASLSDDTNYEIAYVFYNWNTYMAEIRVFNLNDKTVNTVYTLPLAQDDEDPDFGGVYDVSWSPTENSLIFWGNRVEPTGGSFPELYLLNLSEDKIVFIGRGLHATWNYEGKYIIYDSESIYRYEVTTGMNEVLLVSHIGDSSETTRNIYNSPYCAVNDNKIVYTYQETSLSDQKVYIYSVDNKKNKEIAKGWLVMYLQQLDNPWSPDGNTFIFYDITPGEPPILNTINIDGTERKQIYITNENVDVIDNLSWSPDGNRITFTEETYGWPQQRKPVWEIKILNIVNNEIEFILNGRNPVWFPDGERILYICEGKLSVYNINSKVKEELTEASELSPFSLRKIDD